MQTLYNSASVVLLTGNDRNFIALRLKGCRVALAVLRVQLLGTFSLVYQNTPVKGVNTLRLQSLLAYLILHADSPQLRQHLAFILWPDTDESHARNNLRQYLHQLRQALPDPNRFLVSDSNVVYWKMDPRQVLDVQLFEHASREADAAEQRGDTDGLRQALLRAVSSYEGDLLPGCYDEWITPQRDRLLKQCHRACQKLVRLLETQREYSTALTIAQRLLSLDSLDESTYITLMRLHLLNEDRPSAQRVYQNAVETIRGELGVEPSDALRAAHERVRHSHRTIAADTGKDTSTRTPKLVGRQAEWEQLRAAWRRAADGDAHLALVTGEAGIGKSRLAEELYNWAAQQGFVTARTRSYAAEGRLALAPVTEWLRSSELRLHFTSLDPLWLTEVSRLLPELLAERKDLAPPEPIGEYGQRQRFFEALARAVLSAPRPMLLWIDDLQWCDPETMEWLHFLLRFEPISSVLILGTSRSEESPPDHPLAGLARQLRSEGKLTSVELAPIDAAETSKLAAEIGGRELDATTAVRLYRETEGNPLFIVETVRAGISESASLDVADAAPAHTRDSRLLPPRVYAVIASRLAQLSPVARHVAELGAAIGRAFTLDLLFRAGNEEEESLTRALDELWQRRIVREKSVNLYDFSHDKLRDVAYVEMSAPQRRLLHRHIARALETLNTDNLDPVSAQIAAQYEQAGLFEQAIPYYHRAGTVAANVYANEDAITLLVRGLELLAQMPPGEKRDAQELLFLLELARLYRITKGWASSDMERLANRAWTLGKKVGNVSQQIETLFLLQTVQVVKPWFDQVLETETEIRRLLAIKDSPPLAFTKIHWAGAVLHHRGQFIEGRKMFEEMLAQYDEIAILELQASLGVNYVAMGYVWNSHALWCLGYPQKAYESCRHGDRVAREFPHPFSQALTFAYLALLQELRADADTFHAQAEEAFAYTAEHRVTYYYAWANILVHFARAWEQPNSDNLAQLREAIGVFTQTGARLRMPYYLSLLARALDKAGQWDDALGALEDAFAESRRNDEHWWDAELYRLRGELMLARGGDVAKVESQFHQALEIAQMQQGKSLELRAAMSLARLWLSQERKADARRLLVPLYAWFTEGFDTPDLQAAQALISELERD